MVTLYVFLLIVGVVGAGAYVLLFFTHVPGAKDERLGVLEPLPEGLGSWSAAPEPDGGGLIREERTLLADPSGVDCQKLIVQIRFRDPETSEIVRVEPERTVRRRRQRS